MYMSLTKAIFELIYEDLIAVSRQLAISWCAQDTFARDLKSPSTDRNTLAVKDVTAYTTVWLFAFHDVPCPNLHPCAFLLRICIFLALRGFD
jgi:hypothetical protein